MRREGGQSGEGEHHAGGDQPGGEGEAARDPPAVPVGVEHREETARQLRGAGHGETGRRGGPDGAERAGDVQQVAGIVRGLGAGREHPVVAGVLALDPQLAGRHPDQGVEPVEGADHFGGELRRVILPGDVGELMEEDRPPPRLGPCLGSGRQQHHGPAPPPGHRHRPIAARDQRDRPADAHLGADLAEEPRPGRVLHGRGACRPRHLTRRRAIPSDPSTAKAPQQPDSKSGDLPGRSQFRGSAPASVKVGGGELVPSREGGNALQPLIDARPARMGPMPPPRSGPPPLPGAGMPRRQQRGE